MYIEINELSKRIGEKGSRTDERQRYNKVGNTGYLTHYYSSNTFSIYYYQTSCTRFPVFFIRCFTNLSGFCTTNNSLFIILPI